MTKFKLLFLCVINLMSCISFAQQDDSHKPNAPKGAGTSNTISVDPFTGLGSVNIPIYEYTLADCNFPISVSYDAKGIRVDELASSVGLGWELVTGSTITREVKGIEDEVTLPSTYRASTSDHYQGYLAPGSHAVGYTGTYVDDTTADIFYVNLGGRSLELSFVKDNYGNISYKTFPKSEIIVEVKTKNWSTSSNGYTNVRSGIDSNIGISGPDSNFLSFKITDEQGNVFQFERGDIRLKEYELDSSKLNTYSGSYWSVENWNLVSVSTISGTIVFQHVRKYMQYLETITETLYRRSAIIDSGIVKFDPVDIKKHYWKGYKTHISQIDYPNNTIATFQLDTSRADCVGNYRVNHITIKNQYTKDTNNFKNVANFIEYDFNYFMFNTPYYGLPKRTYSQLDVSYYNIKLNDSIPSSPYNKDSLRLNHLSKGLRLGLGSITRLGSDNASTEPYYFFTYDTSHAFPYRFAPNKDYYGFYNGKANYRAYRPNLLNTSAYDSFDLSVPYRNYSYIGNLFGPSSFGSLGQDRGYDLTYARTNCLVKITNGCFGSDSIQYTYETLDNPDSAYGFSPGPGWQYYMGEWYTDTSYVVDPNMDGMEAFDGLIVDKVISKDGYSSDNTVITDYEYSDGVRFNQGGYMWYYGDDNPDSSVIYTNYFVSPDIYYSGSNHGFSATTIYSYGYNMQSLSKTKYFFSNLMYYDANGIHKTCMQKYTGWNHQRYVGKMEKWRMGNLLKTESYDENNFIFAKSEPVYEEVGNYGMRLKLDKNTIYINDRSVPEIRSKVLFSMYDYDMNDNVVRTRSVNATGDTIININKYNYDYYPTYSSSSLYYMSLDQVQYILSSESWKKTSSTDSVLLGMSIKAPRYVTIGANTYLRFPSLFRTKMRVPLTSSMAAISNTTYINREMVAYNGSTPSASGANLFKFNETTQFNEAGSAIEMQKDNHDEYISYIHDEKTGNCIAQAMNARYSDIAYTSFDGVFKTYCPSCSPTQTTLDYSKGNWEFYTADMVHYTDLPFGKAITGSYAYELKSGNYLRTQELNNNTYMLTFWLASDTVPTIALYNGATNVGSVTTTKQTAVGDWKLYKAIFTASSGNRLKFTSSTSKYIDEVRLHPVGAVMTSSTYIPFFGVGTVADANNYITYYEYTPFGKLLQKKDLRGNIITKVEAKCSSTDLPSEGSGSTIPETDNNSSSY